MKNKKLKVKSAIKSADACGPSIEKGTWPLTWALLYSLSIAIAASLAIFCVLKFVNPSEKGGDDMTPDEQAHIIAMTAAQSQSADVVALTNSRVAYAVLNDSIRPPFQQQLFNGDPGRNLLILYLPGGYPRAFRFLLDRSGYKCLKNGGTVVYFPTPMEFNRNGKFFGLTINAFYSWREVLTELLPYGRFGNIKAYLTRGLIKLGKYSTFMKEKMFEKMINKDKQVTNPLDYYRNDYYWKYKMDKYQIDSLNEMIDGVRKKGGKFILVMPPLSGSLREILGKKHLDEFIAVIKNIAAGKNVPVIDYLTGYTGDEYSYMDGSHFDGSGVRFVANLIKDLQPLLGVPAPQPQKTGK